MRQDRAGGQESRMDVSKCCILKADLLDFFNASGKSHTFLSVSVVSAQTNKIKSLMQVYRVSDKLYALSCLCLKIFFFTF